MSKREAINRYSLIINKLRRAPASFKIISGYLSQEADLHGYNYKISKRTFQRDLEDIRNLFNIDIQYNYSSMCYHIEGEDKSDYKARLLEAYDTFSALNVKDRFSESIIFERTKAKGTEHLKSFLKAIEKRQVVSFEYYKFSERVVTHRKVYPYIINEYRNRWYLLALDVNDKKVKNFAFDRIQLVRIEDSTFKIPCDFVPSDYYHNCFGIERPAKDNPKRIVLSFDTYQGQYIKTLPLHHSQQILIDDEDELRISIHINITNDFIMELKYFGDTVEVIQPKSLKEHLKKAALGVCYLYS